MTGLLAALASTFALAAADPGPALERAFPQPELNYIVMDVRSREVLASRWPDANVPVPVGSLVKPFLAMAQGGARGGRFPEFECKGAESGCWLAHGHGRLTFSEALAQSCNGYFLNLARQVDSGALSMVAAKFGISPPRADTAEARIGLGDGWQIAPLQLVRAYAELAARRGEPHVDEILTGLERAARIGTARAIGAGVLAKTGTAECVRPLIPGRRDAGDGFVLAMDPAEAPRVALLVRVHNVPGAEAAKAAAKMLGTIRTGK
jgi:cell division protein FtsI/penicillin-binding protein 2